MEKLKKFVLKKLGIFSIKQKVSKVEKENANLHKQNEKLIYQMSDLQRRLTQAENANASLKMDLKDLQTFVFSQSKGLSETKRDRKIIISITSFPARIGAVVKVLERMLLQTMRPDKIVLWLSKDQFLGLESDLPNELLAMKSYGIEIKWCDGDIKAYKKVLPALKEYSKDLIVIIDDDLVFRTDFVERLYKTHLLHPDAIIASRVHQIKFEKEGKIAPYKKWKKECDFGVGESRLDWFFTGGAGTLIPPGVFGSEVFDIGVIERLCPYADDIWLNIHSAINRIPIVNTANNNHLTYIEGTQDIRLYDINKEQNDAQLTNVIEYYREQLRGTVYGGGQ